MYNVNWCEAKNNFAAGDCHSPAGFAMTDGDRRSKAGGRVLDAGCGRSMIAPARGKVLASATPGSEKYGGRTAHLIISALRAGRCPVALRNAPAGAAPGGSHGGFAAEVQVKLQFVGEMQ